MTDPSRIDEQQEDDNSAPDPLVPPQPLFTASASAVQSLLDNVNYLWSPCYDDIIVYDSPPSAFVFLRDHVARSRPCLIRKNTIPSPYRNTFTLQELQDLLLEEKKKQQQLQSEAVHHAEETDSSAATAAAAAAEEEGSSQAEDGDDVEPPTEQMKSLEVS